MGLWYVWRTDMIPFTAKMPRSKRDEWLRYGAHRERDVNTLARHVSEAMDAASVTAEYRLAENISRRERVLANLRQFRKCYSEKFSKMAPNTARHAQKSAIYRARPSCKIRRNNFFVSIT